jgi:hypothetical protein
VGDDVIIQGSSVANYNGRFTVATVPATPVPVRTFTVNITGLPAPPTNAGITARQYVPSPLAIKSINYSGGLVTVETYEPHFRKMTEHIRVAGIKVTGSEDNYFNGCFPAGPVTSTTIQYTPVPAPPAGQTRDGSQGWLDRWKSQSVIISDAGLSWASSLATAITSMPHFKAPGDWVLVGGAGGGWDGYHKVTSAPESRKLVYELTSAPTAPYYPGAWLPQTFQALSATAGYGGRVYGNRVVDVYTGGPYHDSTQGATFPEKDLITWNNYYYFVYVGPFTNVQLPKPDEDYRQWWNITHDNVIDLQPFAQGRWNHTPPGGILYWGPYGQTNTKFPSIHALVVHNNIIRFVDWNQGHNGGVGYNQFGIDCISTGELLAEDNLVTFSSDISPIMSYCEIPNPYPRNNLSTTGTVLDLRERSRPMTP